MSFFGTSLNAATAIGIGSVIQFDKPRTNITMQVTTTGAPSGANIDLEISLDGVNFVRLNGISGIPSQFMGGFTHAVLFARANLTLLTGGTNPTVTAIIAASDA